MPAASVAALGLAHAQAVVWEGRLEALRRPDPAAPEQPRALVRLPRVHDPVCAAVEPVVSRAMVKVVGLGCFCAQLSQTSAWPRLSEKRVAAGPARRSPSCHASITRCPDAAASPAHGWSISGPPSAAPSMGARSRHLPQPSTRCSTGERQVVALPTRSAKFLVSSGVSKNSRWRSAGRALTIACPSSMSAQAPARGQLLRKREQLTGCGAHRIRRLRRPSGRRPGTCSPVQPLL